MYHRMYLRRSSMSSISEESETGEELNINETIHRNVCNSSKSHPTLSLAHTEVEHCLGDLKNFKRVSRLRVIRDRQIDSMIVHLSPLDIGQHWLVSFLIRISMSETEKRSSLCVRRVNLTRWSRIDSFSSTYLLISRTFEMLIMICQHWNVKLDRKAQVQFVVNFLVKVILSHYSTWMLRKSYY